MFRTDEEKQQEEERHEREDEEDGSAAAVNIGIDHLRADPNAELADHEDAKSITEQRERNDRERQDRAPGPVRSAPSSDANRSGTFECRQSPP